MEQCLLSVQKAIDGLEAEVWVVDNASSDGSIPYLKDHFPWVQLIENERNVGFAKANNQALTHCRGRYVLYLNPDTLLAEDSLHQCTRFLDAHPQAGATGIRMIDGQGNFLPESKRSFPSPFISLYKLVGLSSLFPRSRIFARYALGHLDPLKNHEVDVLSGAFLMARRTLLQQLHGFDEAFFMYGEDIDLSYRIQQAGFKNYYLAQSTIIHFKGESTRKGSLNYVRMFYQAMSIFVKKHYGGGRATLYSVLIRLAIWLRAGLSAMGGLLQKGGFPIADTLLTFTAFAGVLSWWVAVARHGQPYSPQLTQVALPAFTLLFIVTASLAGLYDRFYKLTRTLSAGLVAVVVMLAAYSLLPERFRFSRGVILLSGLAATLLMAVFRWLLLRLNVLHHSDEQYKSQQTLVVGTPAEYSAVSNILLRIGLQQRIMGRVAPNGSKDDAIFTTGQMPALLGNIRVREIIFCEGYLSFSAIIHFLQHLPLRVHIRFHARGSQSIVGSDSKDAMGEFVAGNAGFELARPDQRRRKRLADIVVALVILFTFPVHLLARNGRVLCNALLVLAGKKTWVGYQHPSQLLPRLRPAVLAINGRAATNQHRPADTPNKIDEWYARNYHWLQDVKLVAKHYRQLGRRC